MNSHEAYNLLGVNQEASEKDIDMAFRKKAAKLHPDVNKSESAESDFKKLNEAYQLLKKPDPYAGNYSTHSDFDYGVDEFLNMFRDSAYKNFRDFKIDYSYVVTQDVSATITISFEEAVIGCIKPVSYKRKMLCDTCSGTGHITETSEKPCSKCDGKKVREINNKSLPCTACRGTGNKTTRKPCLKCKGASVTTSDFSVQVTIPPGIENNTILSLSGLGNVSVKGITRHSNANIRIMVEPDSEMKLAGRNVTSVVKITLLEALTGVSKSVRTVRGNKTLKIPECRKHGDQIEASGLGVPPYGKHIFILDIQYPDNVQELIQFLKDKPTDGYIES